MIVASTPTPCLSLSSSMPASATPPITTVQRKLDWKRVCLAMVQEKKGDASVSVCGANTCFWLCLPLNCLRDTSRRSLLLIPTLTPPSLPPSPPFSKRCQVNLPPTLLLEGGVPIAWLFTSVHHGVILKKKEKSLMDWEAIQREFMSSSSSSSKSGKGWGALAVLEADDALAVGGGGKGKGAAPVAWLQQEEKEPQVRTQIPALGHQPQRPPLTLPSFPPSLPHFLPHSS